MYMAAVVMGNDVRSAIVAIGCFGHGGSDVQTSMMVSAVVRK